jgi:hypothetical protein
VLRAPLLQPCGDVWPYDNYFHNISGSRTTTTTSVGRSAPSCANISPPAITLFTPPSRRSLDLAASVAEIRERRNAAPPSARKESPHLVTPEAS